MIHWRILQLRCIYRDAYIQPVIESLNVVETQQMKSAKRDRKSSNKSAQNLDEKYFFETKALRRI